MKSNHLIILLLSLLLSISLQSQNDDKDDTKEEVIDGITVETNSVVRDTINPLAPAKAAFLSAILPGLGQAYNKKYWKIPVVYVALGTGLYFYIDNTNEYNRYRDAYKRRLAGFDDDEFWGTDSNGNAYASAQISNEALIRAQNTLRRNRELSLLITTGLYILNIIDANVDAHLLQYNVDDNLALKPHFKINEMDATSNLGLTLNFKF